MVHELSTTPVHLGLGATATVEPPFTGMEWYTDYVARHVRDGLEGRLLSMYTFDKSWSNWEMHPHGSEVVICTAGKITLVQEVEGQLVRQELVAGQFAINAPGVWHTADVETMATAVFVTAGVGTQSRPRS